MDKTTALLLETLKQALLEPGEQRLFRSGKLPGLFARRTGTNVTAAKRALRERLLQVVRTESKGKREIHWVRPTPHAVDFVHQHESPTAILQDLQHILETTKLCLPVWVADIYQKLQQLTHDLTTEMHTIAARLDALSQRVEEAIDRAEAAQPSLSQELNELVPWAAAALNYLDRRAENGIDSPCALSELFAAVKAARPTLTLAEFHIGLRRLFDRQRVRLLPFDATGGAAEPEYALLDGLATYYYVTRSGREAA